MMQPGVTRQRAGRTVICTALLLLLVTVALFWQTGNHDFINYDDNLYVTENPRVQAGISWQGIRWAFTAVHASNWHPLTWLSHMLDIELHGLNPRGHHLTNVLLHGMNVSLLFLLLATATGSLWPSLFTAALFAVHPLRVESVAWIAERKDVLSTLFALSALLAYIRYKRKPHPGWYMTVFCLLALGLLSKPMLVTLPFVMLLLDYWPLRSSNTNSVLIRFSRLVYEKIPLLLLAVVTSLITLYAQHREHAVASINGFPLISRLENAVEAYVHYLESFFYPAKLAVFYPLPTVPDHGKAFTAFLLLCTITLFVIRSRQRLPFLVTGWFWYLITLVPVVGFIKVGQQAWADRYTYIPMIGVTIALAWGAGLIIEKLPALKTAVYIIATAVIALCCGLTYRQSGYWQNSQTLFQHATAVTGNNYVALSFLGTDNFNRGNFQEAFRNYALSLSIMPEQAEAQHNLALCLIKLGDPARAETHFRNAINIMPDMPEAHHELGMLLLSRNEVAAAICELEDSLRLAPEHIEARYALGIAYARQGRFQQALQNFNEVLRQNPSHDAARQQIGIFRQYQSVNTP